MFLTSGRLFDDFDNTDISAVVLHVEHAMWTFQSISNAFHRSRVHLESILIVPEAVFPRCCYNAYKRLSFSCNAVALPAVRAPENRRWVQRSDERQERRDTYRNTKTALSAAKPYGGLHPLGGRPVNNHEHQNGLFRLVYIHSCSFMTAVRIHSYVDHDSGTDTSSISTLRRTMITSLPKLLPRFVSPLTVVA